MSGTAARPGDGARSVPPNVVVVADRRWYRQFLKFGTVGVFNTGLELALFNALLLVHPPRHDLALLTLYSTLGVVVALVSSYALNTRWVFRHAAHTPGAPVWRRRLLFVVQAGVNIGINDAVTVGLTAGLSALGAFPVVIDRNIAKFAAMFSSSVFSFFVLRHVVFPERRR
ncbi:MAG: GtrA family protein [Acidimicrobiales bacterium]